MTRGRSTPDRPPACGGTPPGRAGTGRRGSAAACGPRPPRTRPRPGGVRRTRPRRSRGPPAGPSVAATAGTSPSSWSGWTGRTRTPGRRCPWRGPPAGRPAGPTAATRAPAAARVRATPSPRPGGGARHHGHPTAEGEGRERVDRSVVHGPVGLASGPLARRVAGMRSGPRSYASTRVAARALRLRVRGEVRCSRGPARGVGSGRGGDGLRHGSGRGACSGPSCAAWSTSTFHPVFSAPSPTIPRICNSRSTSAACSPSKGCCAWPGRRSSAGAADRRGSRPSCARKCGPTMSRAAPSTWASTGSARPSCGTAPRSNDSNTCLRSPAATSSGARASASPTPDRTSRRYAPRRAATATPGTSRDRRSGPLTRRWRSGASCSPAPRARSASSRG